MAIALSPLGTTLRSLGTIGLAEDDIFCFKIFSHLESGYTEKL